MSTVYLDTVKMGDDSRYHRAQCLSCNWDAASLSGVEIYQIGVAHVKNNHTGTGLITHKHFRLEVRP